MTVLQNSGQSNGHYRTYSSDDSNNACLESTVTELHQDQGKYILLPFFVIVLNDILKCNSYVCRV